ncbi:MAG: GNAT family N-acetyltransferase, partial [Thermoplasmata archaeon]
MALRSEPLTPATWPAFARLVEKHQGIFGGCWCISFHLEPGEGKRGAAAYRAMKEERVRDGRAHAALVFD